MSETIQRYRVGIIGGAPNSDTGRSTIDLVTAKRGIAVLYADHKSAMAKAREVVRMLLAIIPPSEYVLCKAGIPCNAGKCGIKAAEEFLEEA